MAIGDTRSDCENDISGNANINVQPSSGDEWLVGLCMGDADVSIASPNQGNWFQDAGRGSTSVDFVSTAATARLNVIVSNSENMDFNNSNGSSRTVMYFAIEVST